MGEIGGNIPPTIVKDYFNEAIQFFRHPLELYRKPNIINCTCYNPDYESGDPKCPLCGGTGSTQGWSQEPDYSFLGIVFMSPEGNQDQHQRLYSKPGPVDTFDGRIYIEGRWFDVVHNEDIIIWRLPNSTEGFEFLVISVSPRFGQFNEIIFVRLDVTRTPTRKVLTAPDVKRHT
jgi:hypothetical protein